MRRHLSGDLKHELKLAEITEIQAVEVVQEEAFRSPKSNDTF